MKTPLLTDHVRGAFQAIGAQVKAVPFVPPRRSRRGRWSVPSAPVIPAPQLNLRDEVYELVLPRDARATVLDCRRDQRHLVLSLQSPVQGAERFLCGFDERHWFAAAVTGHSVMSARDSLMPPAVRDAVDRAGLRHHRRYRRHNAAFLRQGEWFFVPDPIDPGPLAIHYREPLVRPGGGKPHIVDELVRGRGEMVWVHPQHAFSGIRDDRYRKLPDWARHAKGWRRMMRMGRETPLHVRGAVRHPDHATLHLRGWHRVFINTENRPDSLGFLD